MKHKWHWRSVTEGIEIKLDKTPLPIDHRKIPWPDIRKHSFKSKTIGEFTMDLLNHKINEVQNKLLNTIDMFNPRLLTK